MADDDKLVPEVADAMYQKRFGKSLDEADPRTVGEYLDMARAAVGVCRERMPAKSALPEMKLYPDKEDCPSWEPETSKPSFLAAPYTIPDEETDRIAEEKGI